MPSDPWPVGLEACGSDCKGRFSDSGLFLVNWQKLQAPWFRWVQTSVAGAAVAAEGSGWPGEAGWTRVLG